MEPGFDEKELTTLRIEDTSSHEIYKRETTTEVSENTSHPTSTELIGNNTYLYTTKVATAIQNFSAENNTESHTKLDFSSSASTKTSLQNSETTTSTSDALNSSAQSTFTSTSYTASLNIVSNFTNSSVINTSTNEDVIFSTTSVTENKNQEILALNTSSYDYQSTESSPNNIDYSTIDSSFAANFQSIYDSTPSSGKFSQIQVTGKVLQVLEK